MNSMRPESYRGLTEAHIDLRERPMCLRPQGLKITAQQFVMQDGPQAAPNASCRKSDANGRQPDHDDGYYWLS
jgi:hypothetical protein